ncbi:MAG: hypothetical protein E6K53_10270 [Gammaproteobacteria bacterium]|nr:MAG: hypothetical protein E6K53_10270 [Gammaproteobacteria bacterium]
MSDEKTRAQQQFELEFEAFLRNDEAQLAALYRKLPLAAPDAQLDARVRALAQRELALSDDGHTSGAKADVEDANLTPTRMYLRHPRWLPALGAAAMLVLAAGIAWRMAPSAWTSRERTNAPVTAAVRAEEKAKLDSGANADKVANAVRESSAPKPPALSAPPTAPAQSQPGALAKTLSPEPVRTKAPGDAPIAASKPEPQAFPTPSKPKEVERRQQEKVENSAATATYAAPAPPPPAAAAPVATEAAPSVAQSTRTDEISAKQALQPRAAAGAALNDAARAKSVAAPAPASAVGSVQSSMATCPAPQGGAWHGHYPPEIPPTPLLRRLVVKNLIGQAHREEARRAYADFRTRCPTDSWPPDILNQLQIQ